MCETPMLSSRTAQLSSFLITSSACVPSLKKRDREERKDGEIEERMEVMDKTYKEKKEESNKEPKCMETKYKGGKKELKNSKGRNKER